MIQAHQCFAIRGNQCQVLHEGQDFPNTEELAKSLATRWEGHKIKAYPDPTGKSRKTSAPIGQTDLSILKDYGISVFARRKSPPIVDSVKAVNSKMMTAAGECGFYIHPRCENTIKALERVQWVDKNPDLAAIDKTEGIEHWADSIRYPIEYLWRVQSKYKPVSRGFNF